MKVSTKKQMQKGPQDQITERMDLHLHLSLNRFTW